MCFPVLQSILPIDFSRTSRERYPSYTGIGYSIQRHFIVGVCIDNLSRSILGLRQTKEGLHLTDTLWCFFNHSKHLLGVGEPGAADR